MKSKEEIEAYLGIKIKSSNEEQTRDSSYAMSNDVTRYVSKEQQYYTVTAKVLSKESEKALKNLLKESIDKGDLETASTCHTILMEESTFYKNHPNAIGLDINEGIALNKYEEEQAKLKAEQEAKEKAEEQARLKAEQEAKETAEEQARLKAEQEAKEKAEEQARLKAEQEEKERAEEQARLKAEQEEKEKAEEQARLKAEQEEKEKAEKQARLKAEQEAKEKAEKQARLKAEQEAKETAEEQARLKAEQEEKERQESIDKDITEYEQYEELISRKPELDKLLENLKYQEFSAVVYGRISKEMQTLLNDLKNLPENERKIILQQYNKFADLQINEQGNIITDEMAQGNLQSEGKGNEQKTIEEEPSIVEENIEGTTVTGTNIDSANMLETHLEYMRNHQTEQTSQVVADYWNEIHSQQAKVYEQQQPEKIRPREKSIKDEVGDELRRTEQQTQKQDTPSVDLWMNRFSGWYSAIDRVSQNVKDKFIKMKSDIIKAISQKLKERINNKQVNSQEQDTNER